MILAGDIGGTKTHLAYLEKNAAGIVEIRVEQRYSSTHSRTLGELVQQFQQAHPQYQPEVACFGVAGPVRDGRCVATNLPWVVDEQELVTLLGIEKVRVINDLEALAYSVDVLPESDLEILQRGEDKPVGNACVIAAGTGLGEAGMHWDRRMKLWEPFACEGGHADFSPRTRQEEDLQSFLRRRFDSPSWEHVLSGRGLMNLYKFFLEQSPDRENPQIRQQIHADLEEAPALISLAGHENRCPTCREALDLFISLYGAEAGNLALKMMATGGVFVGGGIAPKMLNELRRGDFIKSFNHKDRMRSLLEKIPVKVITNPNAALIGAADYVYEHRLTE